MSSCSPFTYLWPELCFPLHSPYIFEPSRYHTQFLVPSVCGFLCMRCLGNRWTDLCQIHTEDVFGPTLGRVWRSKVKVTRDKKMKFSAFLAACMQCMFGETSLTSSSVSCLKHDHTIAAYCVAVHWLYPMFLLILSFCIRLMPVTLSVSTFVYIQEPHFVYSII